ncbi:MAG: hypothetical protein KL785_00940 [Brevundimonas sp.]|nr:hypothetical protein [Brevundimonas sp.]
MTRLMTYPAVAAALALTASCAPNGDMGAPGAVAAGSGQQCFYADQVRNFRAGNHGQLYVLATRGQVFELNSSGGCNDLDFAYRLAITADDGGLGGRRICTGEWARITLPGSTSPLQTCRALVVRALTEAEVAALPDAHRP